MFQIADNHIAVDHMATVRNTPRSLVLPDLAAIRSAQGISLQQISEATKIRTHYLRAIEEQQYDELPGGVFNNSYIRQYARAIDYDEWDLVAYYESTLPPEEEPAPPPQGFFDSVLRAPVLRLFGPAKKA